MRAIPLLLSLCGIACASDGDPCRGVRCEDQRVRVTVTSEAPLSSVSASAPELELSCEDVSATTGDRAGTRWVCRGRATSPGVFDVTVEADGVTRMVGVDVVSRETECCGMVLEGSATVVLGSDAGA